MRLDGLTENMRGSRKGEMRRQAVTGVVSLLLQKVMPFCLAKVNSKIYN